MAVESGTWTGLWPQVAANEDLLARLRRREARAFDTLVQQHQDRVYRFVLRMMGDREEAIELTQDVFLAIHRHVDDFREDATLATWLLRIARNHALNRLKYLKRRGLRRAETLESVENEEQTSHRAPDDALLGREAQARLEQLLARLEPEHRALILLRDIEGLDYDEMAQVEGLPLGTVKSRLHRARERLAALLAQSREDVP